MSKNKGWREDFNGFFENPSRNGLRTLLQNHVGELDNLDFKKEWPTLSKVARHILGFANAGGGCLVIGIEEKHDKSFEPVGLNSLVDKAEIQKGLQRFIPTSLKYEVLDFPFTESEYPILVGKKFQVLIVEDLPEYIPFVSKSDSEGIHKNTIYFRRGTNTEEANYEEIQSIINRRLETGYYSKGEFDLATHLAELEALYKRIPRYYNILMMQAVGRNILEQENPNYPEEDFESFVLSLIEEKKKVIRKMTMSNQ